MSHAEGWTLSEEMVNTHSTSVCVCVSVCVSHIYTLVFILPQAVSRPCHQQDSWLQEEAAPVLLWLQALTHIKVSQ